SSLYINVSTESKHKNRPSSTRVSDGLQCTSLDALLRVDLLVLVGEVDLRLASRDVDELHRERDDVVGVQAIPVCLRDRLHASFERHENRLAAERRQWLTL